MKYLANQKLWRVVRQYDGYYYELKLAGTVLTRIKIDDSMLEVLKNEGII